MKIEKLLERKAAAELNEKKLLLASICIDLADSYVKNDQYEAAIGEYSIVSKIFKSEGKLIEYACANRMLGEAYTHLCQFEKALYFHRIYLSVARKQQDAVEEQRALGLIGHTYLTNYLAASEDLDKPRLNLAKKFFLESLKVCENLTGISDRNLDDMKTRLLGNLSVVHECHNNFEKAIEFAQRTIAICKSNNFVDQLERNHKQLGSLYVHKKQYVKAIEQINLSIKAADGLKNKAALICVSLSTKAAILIKLKDFRGAKTALHKAYKLNCPDDIEEENIEQKLKIVAAMYYAEKSLLTTDPLDFQVKKLLYETLGDGACALENYTIAIEYYEKMLESARSNGESGSQLSSCLISLAATYRDDKQFKLALKYFQQEYSTCQVNTKESVSTLLNICECQEAAEKNINTIMGTYNRARKESKNSCDKQLLCKVLTQYYKMLRRNNETVKVEEVKRELISIGENPYELNSEPLDVQEVHNFGDDISISNLTDEPDESDTENLERPKTRSYTAKQTVADPGYPVKKQNNCGRIPIHEARIRGNLDIVPMLNNRRASVIDRGGGTSYNVIKFEKRKLEDENRREKRIKTNQGSGSTTKNLSSCNLTTIAKTEHQMKPSDRPFLSKTPIVLTVEVKINDILYVVPVSPHSLLVHNIKWLGDEAANRCSKREGRKPILELKTKNGAILSDDDTINIIFPHGSSTSEVVHARVLRWIIPSLPDNYNKACRSLNAVHNENIAKILTESSASVSLRDLRLRNESLLPVCKAINRQSQLKILDFSGNVILADSMHLLCHALPSLDNLSTLNLCSTGLTFSNLKLLANMFTESSQPILANLTNLDLSYNQLKNESFKYLAAITRCLKLQVLTLTEVHFSGEIFNITSNQNIDLCLDYLVNLDISCNKMNKKVILKFVSWLKPQKIESLNVGNNMKIEPGLIMEVVNWLQTVDNERLKLKTLVLSRCGVTDIEVFDLLRVLEDVGTLSAINLSFNRDLTARSFRRLVNHSSLVDLNLSGCINIYKYFEDYTENAWTFTNMKKVKVFFNSHISEQTEVIKTAWRNKYHEEAITNVELFSHLELAVVIRR